MHSSEYAAPVVARYYGKACLLLSQISLMQDACSRVKKACKNMLKAKNKIKNKHVKKKTQNSGK